MTTQGLFRSAAITAFCFVASIPLICGHAEDVPQGLHSKNALVSDRIVLNSAIYKLETHEGKLCLNVEDSSTGTTSRKITPISYQIPDGGVVSQIELTNFREKGLLAALKIKRDSKADFVEMAFWSKAPDRTLDGKCSSHTFLTTESSFEILSLTSRRGKGLFVVVGKESWQRDPAGKTTEGFLFLDGCPWPCMGGELSPFNALAVTEPEK